MSRTRTNPAVAVSACGVKAASLIVAVLLLTAAFAPVSSAQPGHRPELLNDLPAGTALDAAQQHRVDLAAAEPTTAELRLAGVQNLHALRNGGGFFLTLFRSEGVALDVVKVETRPGGFTAFAELADRDGSAVLVVDGGEVSAMVRTSIGSFEIRPVGRGVHAVLRLDDTAFPEEGEPGTDEWGNPLPSSVQPSATAAPGGLLVSGAGRGSSLHLGGVESVQAASGTNTVIKVLVAYTPSVAAAYSNVNAKIQLAVDETNWSYDNSGVLIDLLLAHTVQVSYTESGSHYTDRDRFMGTSDGYMDNVHSLRNTHGADVMILFINSSSLCGLAAAIPATATTAFATVHHTCSTGNYTFGHEIGHLQGARHDNDSNTSPHAYGHGYCYSAGGWRTIMAVGCSSLLRVPHWSSPLKSYGGAVTGTSSYNDNARVLNNTRTTVAGFRSDPVFSVSITGPTYLYSGQSGTFTANPSNAPGSVTYKWYQSSNGSTWSYLGLTTKSINRASSTSFYLKVEATSGGQMKSDTHYVFVDGNCQYQQGGEYLIICPVE